MERGTAYVSKLKVAAVVLNVEKNTSKRQSLKHRSEKYQKSEKKLQRDSRYNKSEERTNSLNKYNNSQKGRENQARYRASGKDRINRDRYLKTIKGKRTQRRIVMRRYTLLKKVHHVRRTTEQEAARYEDFSNQCAYCGSTERLSLDHFLPIAHGGADSISNLVPACVTCNVRKNDGDPKTWYTRQSFYSHRRWLHILNILGKTDKNYLQIPLL